jgi:hypothetical protein
MSSPVNDNLDRRSMYAPPWARDEKADEEARRIKAEIAAAAERLKPRQAAPVQQIHQSRQDMRARPDMRRDGALLDPSKADLDDDEQFDIEDAIRDAWVSSRLDPVRMPPPPKADGPTWGMLSRLTGAAGFAVIVALFVTGAIPMPSINISLPRGDDRGGRMVEPAVAKPETGKQVVAAPVGYGTQPTFAPRPAPPLPSTVGVAMTGPGAVNAAAVPPAVTASLQPAPRVEPQRPPQAFVPQAVVPQAVSPQAVSPHAVSPQASLPQARVPDFMPTDEMESLIKRGHDLISNGDIAGGRLLLTRAAEAGDARASLALAGTYDAPVMGYLGVVGVPPDAAKARAWYKKAADQGSPEAVRRLERLTSGR